MATNNMGNTAPRPAPAQGLLSGLVLKGEHMIAVGCLTLLIALAACGVGGWWLVSSWTTPADPAPVERIRRGEIEHSSLDTCPAGTTKHYTQIGMVCR